MAQESEDARGALDVAARARLSAARHRVLAEGLMSMLERLIQASRILGDRRSELIDQAEAAGRELLPELEETQRRQAATLTLMQQIHRRLTVTDDQLAGAERFVVVAAAKVREGRAGPG